ncbi:MAG: TonB-linked SusC/RagA family outer membrane protein [Paraglaciecola sp.]|jgi:TonB-linked SusC/RagA family outer membrane protein
MKQHFYSYWTVYLLMFLGNLSFAQKNTFTGIVTDGETKEPLIGVTILVKGTITGTATEYDGSYEIQANSGDTLQFSYTGFQPLSFPLGVSLVNDVNLDTDSEILDEVVVIGYGTIRKSDLTGSVSSVKSEDLIKVPASNAVQALQGKVAGLQILSTSGNPGADPVVRLRGVTTLNNNNPIAVIDGVITDVGAISLLNPNDIASMEVLKDASASAIYGSRGAAGVIIVTTKKGVSGENRISVSIERSVESVANRIDVMTGREFATYLNVITPGTYNNLDVLPETDWQDLVFQENATITNANLSISGGSEKATYYFGLGYFGQEGVLPKSGLDRLTGKLNTGYNLSKNIKVGLDFSVQLSEKDNAPGVINTSLQAWPIDTPFQADGETFAEVNGGNPLAAIEFTNSTTKRLRSLGNLYASINFLKVFTFKSSVQFDYDEGKSRNFSPKFFVGPLQQNEMNDLSYNIGTGTSVIYENTLSYNQDLGKHGISALVGYSAQDARNEFLNGRTEGLLRESELFRYLNSGQEEFERVDNNFGRSTLISYLGRVNYNFDSRYLFTASLRRDGSSKFGPENKYGNFPSAALGWNVHNEGFFAKGGILNRLKVRGSWGIIGNEKIDGNAQYALIVPGTDAVFGEDEGQVPGATFQGGGNPLLKWEETRQINIGVDLGLLEDKLIIEADYYVKKTDDILVPLEPIGYTGIGSFRSIFYNAANVENKGFEWNVSYRNRVGEISYRVGFLGTTVQNKVTDIGQGLGADSLLVGGNLGNGQRVSQTTVGQPIGYFFGYEVEGVFQTPEELASNASFFGQEVGDLRYRDINNDGVITTGDRTIIGSSIPDFIYGFNIEIGYKSFTLSADFQGQMGNEIYNGKQAVRSTTLNYEDKYNNFWNGPGTSNTTPRPSNTGGNFLPSEYYIEDGSFFRLRTLTLNYSLPSNLTQKLKINNSNIYVRATNLFTATDYTGYSPEIGAGSAVDGVIDRGVYPVTRAFTVGLNANF